jgi:hypothetical protein
VSAVSGVTGAVSPALDGPPQASLGINAVLSVRFWKNTHENRSIPDYVNTIVDLVVHRARFYELTASASLLRKQDQDNRLRAAGLVPGRVDTRLGYHRVCLCHWVRWASEVKITYSEEYKRALYKGLVVCASWSSCPLCGGKISERRRVELATAVEELRSRGLVTVLITLTQSHKAGDDLREQVDRLYARWAWVKDHRAYRRLIEQYGVEGPGRGGKIARRLYMVNAFDYTAGYNGHHGHLHPLVFLAPGSDVAAYGREVSELWYLSGGGRFGLVRVTGELVADDMNAWERGCKVTSNDGEVADYITKFGKLPRWDLDRELTKSAVKRGRGGQGHSKHYTPIELLESYSLTGNKQHGARWLEYARAMDGRHQLTWSPGLRSFVGLNEVAPSDEELAGEVSDIERDLASMSGDVWHEVCKQGKRAELLAIADKGSSMAVHVWLAALMAGRFEHGQEKEAG